MHQEPDGVAPGSVGELLGDEFHLDERPHDTLVAGTLLSDQEVSFEFIDSLGCFPILVPHDGPDDVDGSALASGDLVEALVAEVANSALESFAVHDFDTAGYPITGIVICQVPID